MELKNLDEMFRACVDDATTKPSAAKIDDYRTPANKPLIDAVMMVVGGWVLKTAFRAATRSAMSFISISTAHWFMWK